MQAQCRRGLTLIELMITLTLLVIILAIGVPGFTSAANSSRLSSTTNELTSAVQLARAEALRRNLAVVMCRSSDGAHCAPGIGWPGWLVFVDANGNGFVDAGEEVVKSGTIAAPLLLLASPALASLGDRITFLASGRARGADENALLNASLAVCVAATQPAQNTRDLSIAFGGRTAVRPRDGGGLCSAPADA